MLKALLALVLAASAPVCSIPVFRYALERWRAAPYPGVLFHKGPLGIAERKLLREIDASNLNVSLEPVDVTAAMSDEHQALWEPSKTSPHPVLVLRYPDQPEAVALRARFDAAAVAALIGSPRRRETVKLLTEGTSVVWWLVESGVAAKDDAAAELLTRELARLEKEIKIAKPGPDDPPLRSAVPLKVAFTILRVKREEAVESSFLETLARARKDWTLPAAIPVFGRGRALGSLCGDEINGEFVSRMAEYVTDACSCEVKELNPGVDLLFATDWDALLEAGPLPPEPEIKAPPVVLQLPAAKPAPAPATSPAPAPPSRRLLWTGLGTALLVALAAGAAAFRKAS